MNTNLFYSNQIKEINNFNFLLFQNKQNGIFDFYKNINLNLIGMTNDISTADTEISFKNNTFNIYEPKNTDTHVFLKNTDEFVNALFKIYGEDNCLCNYLLFIKNISININMNIDKKETKITLSDYFDFFNKASFLCLNVPFLDKNGKIVQNVFNATLSSMVLIIKTNKIKDNNTYKKNAKNNFSVYSLPNNLIKIEFNETKPPYYRDTLDSKIKMIHKIIGKKRIILDDVIQDKSYFCILWTPADTYKIKSSFLSFYSFDFKLIGNLILNQNDKLWFTSFNNNNNNYYKDFKKDYLMKANEIEKFIKNYYQDKKYIFSNDYNCYINNS